MVRYYKGGKGFDQPYEIFQGKDPNTGKSKPYDLSLLTTPNVIWEWDDGNGNTHSIAFSGAITLGRNGINNKVFFPITNVHTGTVTEYDAQVKVLDGSIVVLHEKRTIKIAIEEPVGG